MLDFLVNHRDTESTERNLVLPDRETAIGQKTQPSGQFLCKQQPYLEQCSIAEVLPPTAEALFPGRRLPAITLAQARRAGLPAREKSISSVTSVSPWLNFFSPITCYSQIALRGYSLANPDAVIVPTLKGGPI